MDNRTFEKREDIPLKDRWATEDLYASDELWEQELGRMVEQGKVMAGYAGTLGRDGGPCQADGDQIEHQRRRAHTGAGAEAEGSRTGQLAGDPLFG